MNSEIFEAARWPGGPLICQEANLPAFETLDDLYAFQEKLGNGTHRDKPYACEFCGWFHYHSIAMGPGGESSGESRYHKHRHR